MSCQRAFEMELEDLLLAPDSEELRSFEAHAQDCGDCSVELSLQRALVAKLRGAEASAAVWHPSDTLLLAYRSDPDGIEVAETARLRSHLSSCGPCHDAFEAFRWIAGTSRVAEEATEPLLQRLLAPLRGLLSGLPAPAALSAGAAIVLGLVVFPSQGPLSPDPGEGLIRGGHGDGPLPVAEETSPTAAQVVLVAGQRVAFDASAAERSGEVSLLLLLTRDAPDTLMAELDVPGFERSEITARRDARGRRFAVLPRRDIELEPGIHRVGLFVGSDAAAPLREYELEVR